MVGPKKGTGRRRREEATTRRAGGADTGDADVGAKAEEYKN